MKISAMLTLSGDQSFQLTNDLAVQGMALVHHIFGNDPNSKPSAESVASAVFTTPQIAGVGYSEEDAREAFPNLNIFTSVFRRALNPAP